MVGSVVDIDQSVYRSPAPYGLLLHFSIQDDPTLKTENPKGPTFINTIRPLSLIRPLNSSMKNKMAPSSSSFQDPQTLLVVDFSSFLTVLMISLLAWSFSDGQSADRLFSFFFTLAIFLSCSNWDLCLGPLPFPGNWREKIGMRT